jgi:hypothetical protein
MRIVVRLLVDLRLQPGYFCLKMVWCGMKDHGYHVPAPQRIYVRLATVRCAVLPACLPPCMRAGCLAKRSCDP